MYSPQELQRKAQLNIHGVDTNAQTSLNNNNPPKQESEQNWFVRGLATIGNFVNNIVMGAVKSIEGIVDAGAMLVGLFGADVDDFVSYDFTADIFGADEEGEGLLEWSWGRNLADVSYLDNDHIVNQIADGVGGMLPTVALAFVSGGTSLAGTAASAGAKAASIGAKVANVASKVAFVAGAAGNASESALQEGATYGQALGYGALSGAIEAGTEMIGGRVFGSATKLDNTLLGKLAVKTGTDKFISKGVGKAVYSFASEGLEEVVADLLDPVNKRITGVDSEAKVDWAQLPKTFFIGGAVGSILDGVQSGASALIHKDKGGKHFVNVAESLEDIANSIQSLAVIQEDSNITQEQVDGATVRNAERNLDSLENMSNEFKEMTEEERTEALATLQESSPSIADMFEPNGDLKEEVYTTLQEIINSGKSSNVSANLTYNVKEVKDTLATVNKSHGYNIELSDTTFTPEQRTNFAKISKAVSGLGRKSGVGLNLAIIKTNKYANAFIEGNTMYVSEEHLADGTWVKQVAHEVSHFTEKTEEFKHFAEFITEDVEAVNRAVAKIVKATDYGFTEADIRSALNKIKQGLKLTEKELSGYQELVAHVTEELLGNEASIERLSRNNTGLARKIYNKIRDILTAIKGTNAEKATVERLKKAEKLFARSLTAVGSELGEFRTQAGRTLEKYKKDKEEYLALSEAERENWLKDKGYKAEDFADDVLDDGNELDNSGEIRYSIKENLQEIHIEDKQEYAKLSQALASKNGNKPKKVEYAFTDNNFYVVKDNRLGHFTPILQVEIVGNEKLIDSIKENIKNGSHRKATTIAEWAGIVQSGTRSDNRDNGSITRRETNGYANELYGEESESNARRNTSQNSRNSKKVVRYDFENGIVTYKDGTTAKFSLKDSAGTSLSLSQREFFKDSKILDENGNLLVMYHGSKTDVNEFKSEFISGWNMFGKGYYFTSSKRRAQGYAKGSIKETYLNITNPFFANKRNYLDKIYPEINNTREEIEEYSTEHEIGGREFFKICNYLDDIGADVSKILQNLGYDGIYYEGYEDIEVVAYKSNQIKLTTNKNPTKKQDIRFSLKDTVEKDVVERYGKTYNWAETGYILTDGTRLDLSGRRDGATGGRRTVDHRDIFDVYEDVDGSDAMIEFMSRGNIRVSPEYPGINIQVEPNAEQYRLIQDLVERLAWRAEYFSVDLDNEYGDVVETLSYEGKVSGRKVVADIKYYFKEGKVPYQSELSKFRFSLKDTATYTLSDGQVKKKVANFTKLKVYSKVEAESIINSILETNFNLEDYSVRISGKTKAEAIDVLWKTLNTADAGKRTGISLKIADYIIDNTIIESIYLEEENQIYTETISFLKPYLHSVDLKALKGEIKYRYDTDNSVYLLWGKRKGEDGQTADQIAMELAESGFFIDAENEADIFFEMDRAYREAVRALKKKSDKFLADTLGKEERNKLRQDIAKDILRAFDSNGKKSKLAEIIEQQKERAKVWKDLYYEEKQRNSAINNLLYEVGKIRDIHFGDFQNSTQSHNLLFRGSIERLSAIKHRGDLNKSGTRSIVAGLNEWYSKDNPVVGDRFIEDISYILNKISSGTGKLTAEEIKGLATAVAYFRHFIETNNKIFRAGKYVDAKPIVEDYIKKIVETQNLKISWAGKVFDKLFNNSKLNYMQTFNDPMTIARYMDKYGDGFFTQTLESFREGAVNSAILEMELNASVEEFYDKHKKFLKNLKAKTVKYNNVEIPADKALYLYMALNREQALMGLARSGFSYKDDKGKTVRVAGFETNEDLTLDDIKIIASEVQSELEKQFTEEEIEYIKIAEKLFNEDCKKLKSERDKTRLGYSNVVDDYYIPIRRAYIAQSVDVDSLQFELDRVSNLSFNKSAVKGAKNELFIESLDLVLSRHLRGIAQYYHLSNVIDNFNIIYNMDIGGNANRVKSIASESVNVWDKGKTYLQDLISDIQGIKRGEGSRVFGFIRGSYAKYQLGANPKVWLTQLSSFFASTSILDYGSVIKGLAIKTNDVDKYCSLAKLRNNDNTAALAQGVLDKVDKVSNVLMKPIGMTDRLVVKKLFGACQVQVQKNTGLKIGTEENKVKAGELLQKVILETQQNTMATERSQAMRSSSELMKTLTMFTSDSMKVVGRVIDSYGELSILKARRKATADASEKANLDKQIKTARKKAAKSTSALVTSAIFMALIAQAFRTLYNKDDEEDNIVENMTVDAVGNLFGGLPIFKDVYAKLVEGYDFDGYQYSAINDLLDSMSDVINLTGDIFSGNADSRDIALNIKKMSYAIGQLFGIPVRNVYNVFYGLTNRISPATAYKIDDIFYKQSYNSDLKKAIKNNDEAMIATIAGLIMNENVGDFENGSTRSEVNRLLSAGFDVLPQSVPSSVTINEVQHSLTGPQQEKFRKAYSGAITAVDKLVSSNGYKIATDEAKAKAIKYVYRYYYYEAQHQALNVDLDSKLYLFGQIVPIEKMALALAEVPLLVENSTNKKTAVQRYLQASKLTSAQKYMLMGYFGYKNTKGEGAVKSAINKMSLTKEQKKLLLEKCGY